MEKLTCSINSLHPGNNSFQKPLPVHVRIERIEENLLSGRGDVVLGDVKTSNHERSRVGRRSVPKHEALRNARNRLA